MPPRRLTDPEPPQLYRRLDLADGTLRGLVRVGGRAVHEHVHVPADQPPGGKEDEDCDEQRCRGVGIVVPRAYEDEPDQHGRRAHEIASEVERVRLKRRAPVAPGRTERHEHAARVDDDHRSDHGQRIPLGLDRRLRPPGDVRDRAPDDEEACRDEEAGLGEGGEMLGLAVAVRVRAVGRTDGDADREEGQERGDEVHARVQRFGDQPEAVGRETGNELERDERRRRADRDERRTALRIHERRLDRLTLRGG